MPNPFASAPTGPQFASQQPGTRPAFAGPIFAGGGQSGGLSTGWGKLLGFGESALESFPEMFGISPSEETSAFRAANPVSGAVSQLVGLAVPYGAAAKGISMVPRLAKVVESAPAFFKLDAAAQPILSGAAKVAAETGIIEGGRLALAASPIPEAVFGRKRDMPLTDLAGDAGVNIAAGGVLGGVFGGIAARVGKGVRISDLVPGADPSYPLVSRVRSLADAIEAGGPAGPDGTVAKPWTEDELSRLSWQREQLKRANFADIEPSYRDTGEAELSTDLGARYQSSIGNLVGKLANDSAPQSGRTYTDALNVLMDPAKRNVSRLGETRLLTVDSAKGFPSRGELDEAISRIGLDKDQLATVGQNHRVIKINEGTGAAEAGDKAARSIENLLTGRRPGTIKQGTPFTAIGDNWFLAREADDGLWITAKKIEGKVGNPKAGDQWFIMKTDRPDVVDPQGAAFRELTINRSAYWPQPIVARFGSDTFDAADMFAHEYAPILSLPNRVRPTRDAIRAFGRDLSDTAAAYLAPAVGVVASNKKANFVLNMIGAMTDRENNIVSSIMDGARALLPGKSAAGQVLTLKEAGGTGLREVFKQLDTADWSDVKNVLDLELPFEKMREFYLSGGVSQRAYNVLETLEKQSRANVGEIEKLKEHLGTSSAVNLLEDFNARAGHYGISRTRAGGFRMMVDDAETGEVAGMVSGGNAKEARDKAIELIREQAKRGRNLTLGGMQDDIMRSTDDVAKFAAAIRKPGFLRERGALLGYDLAHGDLDAERFGDVVEKNIRARERYKTNAVLMEKTWPVMQQIRNENPTVHTAMQKRLDILQNIQGGWEKFQNEAADRVLGHVLGKDSASTIVRHTQSMLNAFQFGFGNIAHYVTNAVSMFQTTFPEAAFLLRTAGKDLSNYVTVPLTDDGGRIVDSVNVLSDVKLFGNSLKLVFAEKPPQDFKDLLQQMVADKQITASFEGGHFGSTGTIVTDLKGAWQDGRSFLRWAKASNEILLAKSEEFNRVVGVATAYQLAKTLGIDDAYRVARFTREFLSKTAFNFATTDRPTIFTTPVGSLMGTFKTWMFHYMANMAKYAGGATQSREMLAPLLWQTGATALLGGAVATPLAMPMANAASKWFTDKDFMSNVYSGTMGEHHQIADGLLYGLPGTLGLSLSSQFNSPGSDPARDATMMASFAIYDRMKALGKGASQAVAAYRATGKAPWEDDQVRDQMIRALAPRTLYRAISVSEDHAIRSMNSGYRVLDNVSLGSGLLYSMGFNPVELDKTYAAYDKIRTSQRARQELTQELGRQLSEAWTDGDDVGASRVFTSALATGVDTASVMRGAKSRMEREDSTQLEFIVGHDKTGQTGQDWGFLVDHEDAQTPTP